MQRGSDDQDDGRDETPEILADAEVMADLREAEQAIAEGTTCTENEIRAALEQRPSA